MIHYAIYDRATGRLISIGKVLPDPMPDAQAFRKIDGDPLHPSFWDERTRTFVVPKRTA